MTDVSISRRIGNLLFPKISHLPVERFQYFIDLNKADYHKEAVRINNNFTNYVSKNNILPALFS